MWCLNPDHQTNPKLFSSFSHLSLTKKKLKFKNNNNKKNTSHTHKKNTGIRAALSKQFLSQVLLLAFLVASLPQHPIWPLPSALLCLSRALAAPTASLVLPSHPSMPCSALPLSGSLHGPCLPSPCVTIRSFMFSSLEVPPWCLVLDLPT